MIGADGCGERTGGADTSSPDPATVWDEHRLGHPHEQPDKAARVRVMFDAIAPTYERINSLFSLGWDARWRRQAVRLARVNRDDMALDIACGTGDMVRALAEASPRVLIGCDFSDQMLRRAVGRCATATGLIEADALRLPFGDGSLTVTTCAFGVRNFADLDLGLSEMYRVLRRGGRTVILEFSRVRNAVLRRFYELYSSGLMPTLASWLSRDRTGAYRYLPSSVVSFDDPDRMCGRMSAAGFRRLLVKPLTLGVVTVYLGWKPEDA